MRNIVCGMTFVLSVFIQFSGAGMVDLTEAGSQGTVNGAIFQHINPDSSAGSGVFNAFYGIQKNGIEEGYNTGGTAEFDTKSPESLLLSAVPIVTIGGTDYREFCLDINQNDAYLSLDELRVYVASTGNLTGYPNAFGTAIYDFDAGEDSWLKMNYDLNSGGSGKGDVIFLLESDLFGSDQSQYVYLYSKFGVNISANDGFEEWGVGVAPDGSTAPISTTPTVVPEPATLCLLGLGGLALLKKRRA